MAAPNPLRDAICSDLAGHLDRYGPDTIFPCIFCGYDSHDPVEILMHLATEHNFAVNNLSALSKLPLYLSSWRLQIPELVDINIYGRQMQTMNPENPDEIRIRQGLHKMRLDEVMAQFEYERTHINENLRCLFCNETFTGTWHGYLQWLFERHAFNPGRPTNLVFIGELVAWLRSQLENNTCIHCGQRLPNQRQLRQHMKKRPHDKIPNQKQFDRYYMVNYLEQGSKWQDIEREGDGDDEEGVTLEEGLKDWDDETEIIETKCLICDETIADPDECVRHMAMVHGFRMEDVKKVVGNEFYKLVRFVNYARAMKRDGKCFVCGEPVVGDYTDHIGWHEQKTPRDVSEIVSDDKYLYPVIEGDALLTVLEGSQ